MKVVLELQDQPSNVRRITVRHDIVIGRGTDCNLRLSAPQVSRRHCFLRVGRDSVSVTDLDSSNGTFIDGTRITGGKRYDIGNGAQLALGPIRFIIHVRSDVAVAETASSGSTPESKRSIASRDPVAAYSADDSHSFNAGIRLDDAKPPMDYAVEQAGESAEPHEPTADYLDDRFSPNGSANLFSNVPDPADSRLGIADFGKRHAEQSDSNRETNDYPGDDIVGKSAIAHDGPQRDSNFVDSPSSPEIVEAASVADDVESAWLSVDDDDTLFPEPMNLGNAYVGQKLHDAFNDVDAGVIEEVEEIEDVMEVHEFAEALEVAEAEHAETNLEEIEEVLEVQDSMEIEDAAKAEQTMHDAEVLDWLNFDEAVEVQEILDVEEVVEVEDALDEAVISETNDVMNVMNVEEAKAIEPEAIDEEHAEVEYFSDDLTVIDAEDVPLIDDVEQIQESMKIDASIAEPATTDDALEIAVKEGGDSNWFTNEEASESDAFFENFASLKLATDNTNPAKSAEDDNEIDPDLKNFLKGF